MFEKGDEILNIMLPISAFTCITLQVHMTLYILLKCLRMSSVKKKREHLVTFIFQPYILKCNLFSVKFILFRYTIYF